MMNRRRFLSCALIPVAAVVPSVAIAAETGIDRLLRLLLQVALGHYETTGVVLNPLSAWKFTPIRGIVAGDLHYELFLKESLKTPCPTKPSTV